MGDRFKNKIKFAQRKEIQNLQKLPIPPQVAIKDSLTDFYRAENYMLNFFHYNHSQCELKHIQEYKPLIDKFNYIIESSPFNLKIRSPIRNSGHYSNLFSKLPPDTDLEEMKFADTGRIIFFRVRNHFCIVSVLARHRRN